MGIRGKMLAVAILLAAATTAGARQVEVRLVRAHQGPGVSRELRDVQDMLRAQLPFPGFELLSSTRVPVPSDGRNLSLPRGLDVRCSGTRERFAVVVRRGGAVLLNVFVRLRDDVPVVLGGFPDGADRLLLILRVR